MPDFCIPYRRYESIIIEEAVDDVIHFGDSDVGEYPCERTFSRWKSWEEENRQQIDGNLNSIFSHFDSSGSSLRDGADGFQKSIVPSSISALLFQMAVHLFCQDVFRDLSYPLLRRRSSTMSSPKTEDWQNAEALRRFQMIAPLMDQTLDSARKTATRRTIADDNGISVKTIRRYESAFRSKGFSGLMPKSRKGSIDRRLPENYSEYVQEAIILKKEVPSRSVSQIITILEGERKAPEGVLKRSTLQRHLYAAGFGEKQMKKYREDQRSTTAVKRFCKPHRMMLAQADIKYGVGILVSADGKKKTAYLSSIIDDHSRYILASEWYEKEDEYAVTDVFRKAILNYGTFDRCYTDNGSVYVSGQLRLWKDIRYVKKSATRPIDMGN